MSDFVSWCRHLLVPFFFMKWHPYIPLHFIEMIFPLVASRNKLGRKVTTSRTFCKIMGESKKVLPIFNTLKNAVKGVTSYLLQDCGRNDQPKKKLVTKECSESGRKAETTRTFCKNVGERISL